MTDKEALLEALEALHYCEALNRDVDERKMQAITVIRKLWTEHAMRETQRLGQEIEQEPLAHWSDCAVHSEPAYPKGKCDCGGIVAVADYTALSDKYVALSDKYVALKAQPEQEPVAHCEAGPNYCWKCLEESNPTYGSEEIKKLREVNKSLMKNIEELKKEPPPFWPVVQHLLDEYGLQFIDIVAAYRESTQPEQEPVAWLSTDSIGERHLCFDKPLDNDPVQPLYTSPPQRTEQEPTVEQIEAAIEAWFNNFKSTTYQKRMRAAFKAANSIKE